MNSPEIMNPTPDVFMQDQNAADAEFAAMMGISPDTLEQGTRPETPITDSEAAIGAFVLQMDRIYGDEDEAVQAQLDQLSTRNNEIARSVVASTTRDMLHRQAQNDMYYHEVEKNKGKKRGTRNDYTEAA